MYPKATFVGTFFSGISNFTGITGGGAMICGCLWCPPIDGCGCIETGTGTGTGAGAGAGAGGFLPKGHLNTFFTDLAAASAASFAFLAADSAASLAFLAAPSAVSLALLAASSAALLVLTDNSLATASAASLVLLAAVSAASLAFLAAASAASLAFLADASAASLALLAASSAATLAIFAVVFASFSLLIFSACSGVWLAIANLNRLLCSVDMGFGGSPDDFQGLTKLIFGNFFIISTLGTFGILILGIIFGCVLMCFINLYPPYPIKPTGPAAITAAAVPTVFSLSVVDLALNSSTLFFSSVAALVPASLTDEITALPVSVLAKCFVITIAAPTGVVIAIASLSLL